MEDLHLIKVASAVPTLKVADCNFNIKQIEVIAQQAEKEHTKIIVFPELSLTGYTCQDLFRQSVLIKSAEKALEHYLGFTKDFDIISIIGLPITAGNLLLNCACVIQKGDILGVVVKTFLPNYGEFYEKRWFASSQDLCPTEITLCGKSIVIPAEPQLFRTSSGVLFGIEICEDVWAPIPPSNQLTLAGADLIFNLSASDELIGKHQYLNSLLAQQSARTISGYIYSGCGFGESTQDVVFGGNALIYENGKLIKEGERFALENQLIIAQIDVELLRSERKYNTTYINAQRPQPLNFNKISVQKCYPQQSIPESLERWVNDAPFIPNESNAFQSYEDILNIQSMGLIKRLEHISGSNVILGISGGLDSTLALLVCVRAFDKLKKDRKGIIGVTMPGFGTTDRTYNNALILMEHLGITTKTINIAKSVRQHFEDIEHDENIHDATYENAQARERTQILMDLANQLNAIVIGTGDLSELALGWATYNGDHMSMYGVNTSIPKTLIIKLVRHIADNSQDPKVQETLIDIIDTPISPELIPALNDGEIKQKTESLVGPYELHDFFLYYFLRYNFSTNKIYQLACKAFIEQKKEITKYDCETIKFWLSIFIKRFFSQQFKRSCLPDGPKVGSVSLSPRGDWRMPSDASAHLWLDDLPNLS